MAAVLGPCTADAVGSVSTAELPVAFGSQDLPSTMFLSAAPDSVQVIAMSSPP